MKMTFRSISHHDPPIPDRSTMRIAIHISQWVPVNHTPRMERMEMRGDRIIVICSSNRGLDDPSQVLA